MHRHCDVILTINETLTFWSFFDGVHHAHRTMTVSDWWNIDVREPATSHVTTQQQSSSTNLLFSI